MSGRPRKFKIVTLGEGRVGKTSILVRYIKGAFDDRSPSTLTATYLDKTVNIDGQSIQLSVWDTAGQERFHALGPLYYRDADAALIVYDITTLDSFERAQHWVKELRKIVGSDISIVLAGNKIDLEKSRAVKHEDAVQYAKSVGVQHASTSAKLNKGLDEVFINLTKAILKAKPEGSVGLGGLDSSDKRDPRRGQPSKKLIIVDEDETKEKGGGCC